MPKLTSRSKNLLDGWKVETKNQEKQRDSRPVPGFQPHLEVKNDETMRLSALVIVLMVRKWAMNRRVLKDFEVAFLVSSSLV